MVVRNPNVCTAGRGLVYWTWHFEPQAHGIWGLFSFACGGLASVSATRFTTMDGENMGEKKMVTLQAGFLFVYPWFPFRLRTGR